MIPSRDDDVPRHRAEDAAFHIPSEDAEMRQASPRIEEVEDGGESSGECIVESQTVSGIEEKLESELPSRFRRHEPKLEDYRKEPFGLYRYSIATGIYLLRGLFSVTFRFDNTPLSFRRMLSLFVIFIGIGSVLLCYYYDLHAEIPMEIISAAILFPISFSIPYIFNRRERALQDLASIKASAVSIYIASREWAPTKYKREIAKKHDLINNLLHQIARFISHRDQNISEIYRAFDELYVLLEELRTTEPWIQSVISRGYQYVRFMVNDFERLRVIHDFHIPSTFRGFTLFYLSISPLLFGPSFAHTSRRFGLWSGLFGSVFSSILLVTLQHIIEDNEDPFDGRGWDDLNFHLIEEAPIHMWKARPWEDSA